MLPATTTTSSYQNRDPGSRLVSALAALGITALLLWLLLRLGLVTVSPPPPGTAMVTLNLSPGHKQSQATQAPAKARSQPNKTQPRATRSTPVPPPIVPPPPTAKSPWNVIWMSHDQMAAADIASLPSHKSESGGGASGEASADASGGEAGAGGPPGPGTLFDADWYRKPTDAELSAYIPKGSFTPGFGEVACKTAERYHVEDCREIGSEPPGSGLGRAVREAAWQFLVMPPRINGRPMIGAWVRIRIVYMPSGDLRAQ